MINCDSQFVKTLRLSPWNWIPRHPVHTRSATIDGNTPHWESTGNRCTPQQIHSDRLKITTPQLKANMKPLTRNFSGSVGTPIWSPLSKSAFHSNALRLNLFGSYRSCLHHMPMRYWTALMAIQLRSSYLRCVLNLPSKFTFYVFRRVCLAESVSVSKSRKTLGVRQVCVNNKRTIKLQFWVN